MVCNMNELKKICHRVSLMQIIQRTYQRCYTVPGNDFVPLDESAESEVWRPGNIFKSKAYDKRQANWESLMLYGPKLNSIAKNAAEPEHKCDGSNPEPKQMSKLEHDLRCNFFIANQKILGNVECSSNPENMLSDNIDTDAVQSVFTNVTRTNSHCDTEFPLFSYHDTPADKLKSSAKKILNFKDGVTCPSVSSLLNFVMPEEEKQSLHESKIEFVTKHGVDTFYACREAYSSQEAAFHSQLQRYFEDPFLNKINLEDEVEWKSVCPILKNVSDVGVLQENISHPYLRYHGFVGFVGMYNAKPALIEFVHSNLLCLTTSNIVSLPLKAAAHLGLVKTLKLKYEVENILIAIVNTQSEPATTIVVEKEICEELWNLWLDKVRKFWSMRKETLRCHVDIE